MEVVVVILLFLGETYLGIRSSCLIGIFVVLCLVNSCHLCVYRSFFAADTVATEGLVISIEVNPYISPVNSIAEINGIRSRTTDILLSISQHVTRTILAYLYLHGVRTALSEGITRNGVTILAFALLYIERIGGVDHILRCSSKGHFLSLSDLSRQTIKSYRRSIRIIGRPCEALTISSNNCAVLSAGRDDELQTCPTTGSGFDEGLVG